MVTKLSVSIVEDDPHTRERMAEKLQALEGYAVAGTAGSVLQAREMLSEKVPNVLLVDLGLPDGSGLDIIREQHELNPETPILVISVFGDEKSVIQAIEAGAQGYLLKSDTSLEIENCLHQLVAGGAPISAGIARHLIKRLRPSDKQGSKDSILSERELEVLQLAAKGYSYQDIAGLLGVKESTISSYTRRLYQKLSVHTKSEAIFEGLRMGLVKKPEDHT